MNIDIQAPAKVNLFLEVLGKRPDGYHDIQSIFHTIGLYDTIHIKQTTGKMLSVTTDQPSLNDSMTANSAYKAAMSFLETFHIKDGLSIRIEKNIPIGGGLGGSSADAAGVIRGLAQLYGIELTPDRIAHTASVGADVPFLIHQGCALVEGIGEKITMLPYRLERPILIAFPGESVNTGWAYGQLTFLLTIQKIPCNILLRCLELGDYDGIYANLFNRFEDTVFQSFPKIRLLKQTLLESGARAALMSGSGSSVFGVYDTTEQAYKSAETVRRYSDWVSVVTPTGKEG